MAYGALAVLHRHEGTLRAEVTPRTIGWFLVAVAGFLLALVLNERAPIPRRWMWTAAVAFRLLLLTTTPTLSDDVYRYLWEGHLWTEGVSPYEHPPPDPALDAHEIPVRNQVNNATLASPYLPAAHAVFAVAALVAPSEPITMQAVMVGFDLLTALLIARLLALAGHRPDRLLLYLWNPLVVVEIAHGAHLDALMVALATAAVVAAESGTGRRVWRAWASPVLLGAAVLTRPLPALLLAVLWWRWTWRQRGLFFGVLVAAVVPFGMVSGWGLDDPNPGTGLFGSMRAYADTFRFNGGIHRWTAAWWGDGAATTLSVAGLALVMGVVAWQARAARTALGRLRLLSVPVGAYLVLTPVLHPWYLLMLVALMPFLAPLTSPGPAEARWRWALLVPWLYLGATAVFSYLTYEDPLAFGEREPIRRLEWLPTLSALAVAGALLASRLLLSRFVRTRRPIG